MTCLPFSSDPEFTERLLPANKTLQDHHMICSRTTTYQANNSGSIQNGKFREVAQMLSLGRLTRHLLALSGARHPWLHHSWHSMGHELSINRYVESLKALPFYILFEPHNYLNFIQYSFLKSLSGNNEIASAKNIEDSQHVEHVPLLPFTPRAPRRPQT